MRTPLRLPALAIVADPRRQRVQLRDGVHGPSVPHRQRHRRRQPALPRRQRGRIRVRAGRRPTPEPAKACAQSTDANAMQMWERSGGNKGMVDILVCAWNAANPTKPINLSYIVHTEMVAKIAQGIASGDVPDLMGMDLIYAPQFENAGQLVDVTDKIEGRRALHRKPGPHERRNLQRPSLSACRCTPTSRRCSTTRTSSRAGLDPNKPPTSLAELADYADKITALGGDIKGYYLPGNCAGCNIFTVGPLMWASGATIEAGKCGDEPLVGDGVKQVLQFARDMVKAGNVPASAQAETGATFAEQFGTGKIGMMGTGNFNITLARDQMKDHPFDFGISLLPGVDSGKYASFIGGDLVVVPNGQQARRRRGGLHEVPAVGQHPDRGLRQGPQPDDPLGHGRQQVLPGRAARPGRGQGPGRRPDAVHPDLLRADQLAAGPLAADAPEGVLHRRGPRYGHRRRQDRDEGHLLRGVSPIVDG